MTTINDILASLSDLSIGVIVTVSVAIAIFIITQVLLFVSKKIESIERLSRVCKALLVLVNELDDYYDGPQYEALKTRHYTPEHTGSGYIPQKKEYTENIINTAPYDGIVDSGLITYLKQGTQKKLHDFFFYVSLHNKRMFDLAQIYNEKASSSEFKFKDIEDLRQTLAWEINEIELTRYEDQILERVDKLKDALDKEIKDAEKWYYRIHRKLFRLKMQ